MWRPLRRDGNQWAEVAWDEVVDRLLEVQDRHGHDAVAVYQGNPTVHNSGSMLFAPPFVRSLRTRNRFSATSVDQLPHHLAAYFMFGHQLVLPVPDVDRTQHMLILGANPMASNGSLMTAPGIRRRLRAIQGRDGRVVVVDPRRTETARIADEHHFIRPGTDILLLLAFLNTLFAEDLVQPRDLAVLATDVERIRDVVKPFAPEAPCSTGWSYTTRRNTPGRFPRPHRGPMHDWEISGQEPLLRSNCVPLRGCAGAGCRHRRAAVCPRR